jgi:hypothetical protein
MPSPLDSGPVSFLRIIFAAALVIHRTRDPEPTPEEVAATVLAALGRS